MACQKLQRDHPSLPDAARCGELSDGGAGEGCRARHGSEPRSLLKSVDQARPKAFSLSVYVNLEDDKVEGRGCHAFAPEGRLEFATLKKGLYGLHVTRLLAPARDCTNFTAERWTTGWVFFPR